MPCRSELCSRSVSGSTVGCAMRTLVTASLSVRAAPLRACRNDFCREVFRAAKKKPQTARRSGVSYRRLRKTRPALRDSHRHAPFFAHIEETPDRLRDLGFRIGA